MEKTLNNKKGFTLVELLAVIVILALIMSIAVISMSGIMQSARQSTFKETALQIINGVRQQLTLANELNEHVGAFTNTNGVDYYFSGNLIEKGGKTSPLGGTLQYASSAPTGTTPIGTIGVWRLDTTTDNPQNATCNNTAARNSFVRVKYLSDTKNFEWSICLMAGKNQKYINVTEGTEEKLLNNNDMSMIK